MNLEPAPLITLDDDPVPPGTQSFWFTGKGGVRLRAALCPAQGRSRGSVLFAPGRTEYVEKFLELGRDLTARGYHFAVIDHRGQGLSDRLLQDPMKGHVHDFADYGDDLLSLHAVLADRLPEPLFLGAHSMGGLIAADVARRGQLDLAGMALSSPMFGFKADGPALVLMVRLCSALGLRHNTPPGVDGGGAQSPNAASKLTSDPVRFDRDVRRNAMSETIHLGTPTFGWLQTSLDMQNAMARPGGCDAITVPVYMASAGRDALVSNAAARAAHALIPNAIYETIAGALHELIEEQDLYRNRFMVGLYALLERAG